MSTINQSMTTFDFHSMAELKHQARGNEEAVARKVGEQFEAMFIDMMMSSVREANKPMKSDLLASSSTDSYEEMYHKELSLHMAAQGSLGIADWIVEQVTTKSQQTRAITDYELHQERPGSNQQSSVLKDHYE